jgi:hypothetical protein
MSSTSPCLFQPFTSVADTSFFQTLSHLKIDVFKLDASRQPLVGCFASVASSHANLPSRLSVASFSFDVAGDRCGTHAYVTCPDANMRLVPGVHVRSDDVLCAVCPYARRAIPLVPSCCQLTGMQCAHDGVAHQHQHHGRVQRHGS